SLGIFGVGVATSRIRPTSRRGRLRFRGNDLADAVVVRPDVRNPLPAALMTPCLVEIESVLPGDVFEFLLAEEEHVVQSLAPQAADKSLGDGIHVWRAHGGLDHSRGRVLGS